MDLNGLMQFFGQRILAVTDGQTFVGTLEPISGSQDTVTLEPLDDAASRQYGFAINEVTALRVSEITVVQQLA